MVSTVCSDSWKRRTLADEGKEFRAALKEELGKPLKLLEKARKAVNEK